jgi:hypothetical protein
MTDKIASKKIIGTSLVLGLIILAFSITSYFSVIKPAMAAGTLTRVNVVPMTNIGLVDTTYDFFFRTATPGMIKTVEIIFPFGCCPIEPRNATLIERTVIGPGTISGSIDTTTGNGKLTYTVTNPVSVAAGTTVRLEVARMVANPGSWFATIATKDTAGNIIDGPTQSPRFIIKFLS